MCVLRNGADGVKSALAGDGILLAGELLLEKLNSPAKKLLGICAYGGGGVAG
jgi:hypothetical protein